MIDRVLSEPKIEVVWNTVIDEGAGGEYRVGVRTTNLDTGAQEVRELSGLFIYVGLVPNSPLVDGPS